VPSAKVNRGTAKIRLKGPIAHRCKGEPAVVLAEALQRRAATSTRPSAGASERAPAGFSGRRLGGCAGRVFRVVAGRGGWSRTRRSCRRGSDREGLQAIRERMAELAPAAERRGPPTGARLCTYSPAVQYSSISKFTVSGSQLTGYRATFDATGNCQAYETRPSPYGGSFYTRQISLHDRRPRGADGSTPSRSSSPSATSASSSRRTSSASTASRPRRDWRTGPLRGQMVAGALAKL
jgi:hypothetical protein